MVREMEMLLYISMVLCTFSVILKVSLLERWKSWALGLGLTLFCYLIVPVTASSSRLVVEQFYADHEARQWVAIVATIESILALAYGFRDWRSKEPIQGSRRWVPAMWWGIKHYLSLLIFPTLFFVQTQMLYALPGSSFYLPATIVGVGALLLTPLLSWLLSYLLPDRREREEVCLYTSLTLSVLVLISTNHAAVLTSRPSYSSQLRWAQLLWAGGIIVVLLGIGYISSKINRHK